MTSNASPWHEGQVVHRPAVFLLGELLNGKVQQLRASPAREETVAQVAWPDGSCTEESVSDLAPGARPAQVPTWRQRALALFTR